MNKVLSFVAVLAALCMEPVLADPLVPRIPGASPVAVNPAIAPEALSQQLREAEQRLSAVQSSLPRNGLDTGEIPMTLPAVPVTGRAPRHRLAPVRAAPTIVDVLREERALKHMKSEVQSQEVADAGLVQATNASHLRARIVFPYMDSSIYEIFAAPDRMTTIELAPGENITTDNGKPKAADTVQWVADTVVAGEGRALRTLILIKPIVSGIETNLLIPTNRHVYNLLLKADSDAYMPLVGFTYPIDEAKAADEALKAEDAEARSKEMIQVAPDHLRFDYTIKGSRVAWRPLRVFDDGSKTYIEMSPDMHADEAPALFVMENRSTPMLVNYRVKGELYIVDRLFQHAQLRIGKNAAVDIFRRT